MPQSLSQKVTNTFIRGLITEAGELTFPADASVDELNCQLERDGSRKRREGINFEEDNVNSTFTVGDAEIFQTGTWYNVGGRADREFLVVQSGNNLHFYDKKEPPYSSHQITGFAWTIETPFGLSYSSSSSDSIPLSNIGYTGKGNANTEKCEFTSISGMLVVANPHTETFAIIPELNETTGKWTFTVEGIPFKVRDFQILSDRDTLSEEVNESTVTAARVYDTRNSGWVGTKGAAALTAYRNTSPYKFPPLNLPWYAGKDADGNFDVAEWKKIEGGTGVIGNGHNLTYFFSRDRFDLSYYTYRAGGTTALPTDLHLELIADRPSTVAAMAGRVFYSGLNRGGHEESNVILFSRIIEGSSSSVSISSAGLGDCFQKNDPTSEDFPDLLDDDGGVIRIPEAYGIRKLHAFSNSLYVFAENGVWQIKGVDDIFKATGYAVNKVSSVGLFNKETFVSADGIPFWWSDVGIHTLGFDSQTFQSSEQNLSLDTIQTFFDDLTSTQKSRCTSVFDPVNKRIYWMYPKVDEGVLAKLSHFLILDLALQAFYPWTVSDTGSTNTPDIIGATFYRDFASEVQSDFVTNNFGSNVVDGSSNFVITQSSATIDTGEPAIIFLCRNRYDNYVSMGYFYDTSFKDWGIANYSSYAEAGYDFMGDLMLKKNAPLIQTYSRVTETGWTGDETNGYSPIREGSLLVSAYWDFSNNGTPTQQAYRLKPMPIVNTSNLTVFGYPDTVVSTRLKIRGRGKSMRLRFESEEGKDFHLLGYGILNAANRRF